MDYKIVGLNREDGTTFGRYAVLQEFEAGVLVVPVTPDFAGGTLFHPVAGVFFMPHDAVQEID